MFPFRIYLVSVKANMPGLRFTLTPKEDKTFLRNLT